MSQVPLAQTPTVLLVDNSLSAQGAIAAVLLAGGLHVHSASSTRDALSALTEQCIDLVLLDATVPAFHDLDFLELLRVDLGWRSLPVIVLAESGQLERVAELRHLGIDLCLAKTPHVISHLPVIIAETLKSARRTSEGPQNRPGN